MSKLIPYGRQSINLDDIRSVTHALKSEFLTTGPLAKKFETKFKNYVGSKYAISCSSGTSGLHLALLALDVKKGDIVILPVINFIASVNMAHILGAKIYFADVDKFTGQMTPKTLESCIKKNKIKKIKAVITMYNGGNPNYAKDFFLLKKKYNFFLIEDACHALGAKYNKKKNLKVGSCKFSDVATFSLHPIKSITTSEGGIISTNNKRLFKKINIFKNHGIYKSMIKRKNNWKYKIVLPGFNYRLSDVSCALGISQIKRLNKFIIERKKIFNFYKKNLSKINDLIFLPSVTKNQLSANHLFVIILNKKKLKISRESIMQKLFKKGIMTQVHYIPIYYHPFYKKKCKGEFLGAKFYFSNCLSLPIFPDIKNNEIKLVIKTLHQILYKYKNDKKIY